MCWLDFSPSTAVPSSWGAFPLSGPQFPHLLSEEVEQVDL